VAAQPAVVVPRLAAAVVAPAEEAGAPQPAVVVAEVLKVPLVQAVLVVQEV